MVASVERSATLNRRGAKEHVAHLGRNLGFIEALTIGVGSMIGAGIFVLSGSAAQSAGPAAAVSFALAGGSVLLTALCFAELATAMPQAGGPYIFVKKAFGEAWGFLVGWSLWVGLALATAFYATGFAQYLFFLIPKASPGWSGIGVALVLLATNMAGSAGTGRLQNAVVMLLIAILGYYLLKSWDQIDPALHEPFFPYGWSPVLDTASIVFVSFLGFELVATAAEEMKNPRRDLPLATVISVVSVVCLYVVIIYAATGTISHFDLGESATPLADAARITMGPWGAILIIIAGLLATVSSANTSIMASSRVGWAMARDGLLPRIIGAVHPKWHSPHAAVLATGLVVFLALLPQDVRKLAGAAGFLHLYPFVVINLAVLNLRKRSSYRPTFRVPGGAFIPISAAAANLFLLSKVQVSDALWGLLLLMPGLAYRLFTKPRITSH